MCHKVCWKETFLRISNGSAQFFVYEGVLESDFSEDGLANFGVSGIWRYVGKTLF